MKEKHYKYNITSDKDKINYYDYCNTPENFIFNDNKPYIIKLMIKTK